MNSPLNPGATPPPTTLAPHAAAAAGRAELSAWLARLFDEIDQALLLLGADAEVLYLNRCARRELDAAHPLQTMRGALCLHRPQDVAPLFDALAAAQGGQPRQVSVGAAGQRITVSLQPLPGRAPLVLLFASRPSARDAQALAGYAHSLGLTPAETRVLAQLCRGLRPAQIAAQQGVALSTVRSQISSVRAKVGADSIRELMRRVARLPPVATGPATGPAAG